MFSSAGSQIEFYRNREFEIDPCSYEMQLLSHLPGEERLWYCNLLVIIGDLLISSGTKLKDTALTSAAFSQERL